MPIIILFLLIFVHELGHFITAMIFQIEVDKIYIYPFGGISKFHLSLNESLRKEFIILIMGPLVQCVFSFFLLKFDFFNSYQKLIMVYNYTILTFNLLPIYPLDGGKLLNILLSFQLSFQKSLNVTFFISYLTIFFLAIYFLIHYFSINVVIMISFLWYKLKKEESNKNYLFDKFLLERYLNHYQFKKRKKVEDINDFMRGKNHLVKRGTRYYTEKEILYRKFHQKY